LSLIPTIQSPKLKNIYNGDRMKGEMRGHMHPGMRGMRTQRFIKEYLTEEEQKKLAVKKIEMKIASTEQKLEYLNTLRDMLKEKI
jgi:hypothetical protein